MSSPNSYSISPASEGSQASFFYRQFFVTPPVFNASSLPPSGLSGQTGIVTGSNAGLGLEASRQLLSLGLTHLILAVRNIPAGEAAKKALQPSCPDARIEVWKLDLSTYKSVTEFVERAAKLDKLNFAIMNAGLAKFKKEANGETGHEEVLQVNYLSTMLLSILLLPVLVAKNPSGSSPGRLTIVSSETASWVKFAERNADHIITALDNTDPFDGTERYQGSKLLGQLFFVELVKRVSNNQVVVNAVNPGFCYGSTLHKELSGVLAGIMAVIKRLMGRSASVGARTLVDAADGHGDGRGTHGEYLGDCVLKPKAPFVYTEEGQKAASKLFGETMAEFEFAGVQKILDDLK